MWILVERGNSMMSRGGILGVLVGGLSAMLWVCGSLLGESQYRYKLTVEVETPNGVRSGFAVRQVNWSAGTKITPEATTSSMSHKGEAVMIHLSNGQTLFALMSPDGQETPMLAFSSARQTWSADRLVKVLTPPHRPEVKYGESGYPRLVRFRDINVPATVEQVNPDNFVTSFGTGYRLKHVTAQIVDEPVTVTVAEKLRWLGKYPEPRLEKLPPGGTTTPTFAQQLTHGDFIQGLQK